MVTTSVVLRIVALLTQVRPESNLGTVHKLVHFGSWKAFLLWSMVRLDTFQIHVAHKNHVFSGSEDANSWDFNISQGWHAGTKSPPNALDASITHITYTVSIFNLSNLVATSLDLDPLRWLSCLKLSWSWFGRKQGYLKVYVSLIHRSPMFREGKTCVIWWIWCHLNRATASSIPFGNFKNWFVVHLLSMLRYSHWPPPVIMYIIVWFNIFYSIYIYIYIIYMTYGCVWLQVSHEHKHKHLWVFSSELSTWP